MCAVLEAREVVKRVIASVADGSRCTSALRRRPPKLDTELLCTATTPYSISATIMDLQEVQNATARFLTDANTHFQRIPGSAIAVRYIKSSYQNDPLRSAIELFLFLFAVRYLLAPKYSTQKKVQLSDAVCRASCQSSGRTGTDV
jgi:hypothetical protein